MEKKVILGIMFTLLLMSVPALSLNIQPVKSEPTTIIVPDDYPTIQEAINKANEGDTIYVKAGTYHEHVVVSKAVSLIGENLINTIVDGSGSGHVFRVAADSVAIENFTIENAGWTPVEDEDSEPWPYSGIDTTGTNCIIKSNNITNNGVGISLSASSSITISGNNIGNNDMNGIEIWSSSFITISGNNIANNYHDGIYLSSSSYNRISGNSVVNNFVGIYHSSSNNNTISGNKVTDNYQGGVGLFASDNNTVYGNMISDHYGDLSTYGLIRYGIALDSSSNNHVYHNNLLNNTRQAFVWDHMPPKPSRNNVWDDSYPSGGNYWGDYVDEDFYSGSHQNSLGSDGIWDHAYEIYTKTYGMDAENIDRYPLVVPLPTTICELKTEIAELGSEGKIDNRGIVRSLIAKLNTAQKLLDKEKIDEAKMVLEDFIMQVQELSGIHITVEAADILIQSAEYIMSHL